MRFVPQISIVAAASIAAMPGAWARQSDDWRFDVFLDDKRIGHHYFERSAEGEITTIQSRARFEVKFWFIQAYTYDHTNIEHWDDGCLRQINAVTDDNGEKFIVSGQRNADDFVVQTTETENRIDGCVRSFAYWDKEKLQAQRLLNSQTGEYVAVQLESMGTESISLGNRSIDAQRYRLNGDELSIDLWYTKDNDWLALETTTDGGRRLHYRKKTD